MNRTFACRRPLTATLAAVGLSLSGTAVTADAAPSSLVKAGEPMRPVAARTVATFDSGLPAVPPSGPAGTVLAHVPLDPTVGLVGAAEQHRFAYTTSDQHGQPATSTGTVFLPHGHAPEGGWPVLAWAHGTVGLGDECAPSINAPSARDAEYLNHWLNQGYAIVASDYAGLGSPGFHSYLNGKVAAANVVDSIQAAHSLPLGAELSTAWAVIGQSQGGGVALHVAHRASALSHELGLDYRGAVATGAPAYIEEIVLAAGPSFPPVPLPAGMTTYGLYILAAVEEAHPEIDLNSALTDEGRFMIDEAKKSCYDEVAAAAVGTSLSRAFTKPLRDVPGLADATRAFMSTPVAGYDKPVFLGHGIQDIDVPSPIGVVLNSDMWLRQFSPGAAARNARVEVHWYPTDHSGTVNLSTRDSTPFLRGVFSDSTGDEASSSVLPQAMV
ncbi:alpha/beta hydrolase [Corynebacterium sp.]|uniref:alpha/beta hydrolase n=1 Tax=Corynebacterium sp. TaxID=1720 RepID=UPI002A90DD39|nr:lipase family protein [Corynebacterium sp.]MDY5786445.1 lipase family protein [Corynebacterium sp.]